MIRDSFESRVGCGSRAADLKEGATVGKRLELSGADASIYLPEDTRRQISETVSFPTIALFSLPLTSTEVERPTRTQENHRSKYSFS